jgi:hypothetical protein
VTDAAKGGIETSVGSNAIISGSPFHGHLVLDRRALTTGTIPVIQSRHGSDTQRVGMNVAHKLKRVQVFIADQRRETIPERGPRAVAAKIEGGGNFLEEPEG